MSACLGAVCMHTFSKCMNICIGEGVCVCVCMRALNQKVSSATCARSLRAAASTIYVCTCATAQHARTARPVCTIMVARCKVGICVCGCAYVFARSISMSAWQHVRSERADLRNVFCFYAEARPNARWLNKQMGMADALGRLSVGPLAGNQHGRNAETNTH